MAGSDNRMDARATTSMRIKLKYPDLETFIQKYAVNISRGGIFIATKQPKPVGTVVRFEFLLANAEATSLIRGEGVVQWTREYDPATPTRAHGMGVKFTRLDADSQAVVDRALAFRASHGMAKKGDSEGITVASMAPAGATPEPMPLPRGRDEDATLLRDAPRGRRDERARDTRFERQEREERGRVDNSDFDREEPTGLDDQSRFDQDRLGYRGDEPPTRDVSLPDRPPPTERVLPTERSLPPVPDDDRILHALDDQRGDSTVLARTLRGDPTALERPSREAQQLTRPVTLPDEGLGGRPPEQETRPIELPDAPGGDTTGEVKLPGAVPMMAQSVDDSVRIALERHRQPRNGRRHGDELDQLIADWNLSIERVEKVIRGKRPRMGAQATAELERLLRKPPKPPQVSKADAIRLLEALLSGRAAEAPVAAAPAGELQAQAQAAGGEPEPDASPSRRRKRGAR